MAQSSILKLLFFLTIFVLSEAGVSWNPNGMSQLSRRDVEMISKIADKNLKKEMEKLIEAQEEEEEDEEEEEGQDEDGEEEREDVEEEEEEGDEEIIEYPPTEMAPPPPEVAETTASVEETSIDTSAECNITVGYLWELCRPVLLKTCKEQYKTVCRTNRRKFRDFSRHLERLFPLNSPPPMLSVPEPLTDWITEQVSDLGQEIGDSNFQVSITITDGNDTQTYTNEDFQNDLKNLTDFVNNRFKKFSRKYQASFHNIIEKILRNVFRTGREEEEERNEPLIRVPKSAPPRHRTMRRHGNVKPWHKRPRGPPPHFMNTQPQTRSFHMSQMSSNPWQRGIQRHREWIEQMTRENEKKWGWGRWGPMNGPWHQRRTGTYHPRPPMIRHFPFPQPPMKPLPFPKPPVFHPRVPYPPIKPFYPQSPWQRPDDDEDEEEEEDEQDYSITCEQVQEDPEICVEIVERTEKCEAELEKVCPDYIQARRGVRERLDRVYDLSRQANVDKVVTEDNEREVNERYEWRSWVAGKKPSILVESVKINQGESKDALVRAKIFGESPFEFKVPSTEFRNTPYSLGKAISRMALRNIPWIRF